jgi:hypothetical protein
VNRIKEFYGFMAAREDIRLKRAKGLPPPWTADPVLRDFKFTNVKRHHDRTSYLLKQEFYDQRTPQAPDHVVLLNCTIFRFFGTIEWARAFGWSKKWDDSHRQRAIKLAKERMDAGEVVWTRAYMIPNCGDPRPKVEVVSDIITKAWNLYNTDIKGNTWQSMCEDMQQVKGIGAFMAKEIMLDYIAATGWVPADWTTWTPMGPGARRGASRIVNDGQITNMSERAALKVCQDIYSVRGTHWKGVPLDLTDIQFQLCEYDKWLRAHNREGRPKNKFIPTT